jgi:Kef-type K+ transport system membrane component KefB/nucleotide-binding universal stress UspA family protein
VSIAGISVPFLCGVALGELLPDAMLPNPDQRLITSLFLGTALSISSVKIVAMVIREMNFMRRDIGQIIMAAAITHDTIGWIIIAIIFGLAFHGGLDLASLARSIFGTALFLLASFSVGRRLVFLLIRWANDNLVSDVPVITTILVVMGIMAMSTYAIGVHTVLGAFVAGILVGQTPILTRHIDEQLRGLIVALFMPVFFGLAGLNADLRILREPSLLLLSLGLIIIASIGKFTGAFLGGAVGGLTGRESLALGCGMNARGSTEVIVASIGLTMGALSKDLFTMIVAMAIVTTMAMPPMLRWALARLPLGAEEKARLEREAFETRGFVPNLERLLVAVDDSASGKFASRLVGLLAGSRRMPITALRVGPDKTSLGGLPTNAEKIESIVKSAAKAVETDGADPEASMSAPVEVTTRQRDEPMEQAVTREARKGYGLLVIGVEPTVATGGEFHDKITRITADFDGPFAIAMARGAHRADPLGTDLDILVPVTGTSFSRRGAELAAVLARAVHSSITALYVATAAKNKRSWRADWATRANEEAILREIVCLGDQLGVPVRTVVRRRAAAEDAILRQLRAGNHNLIVMGVSPRPGTPLFFGHVPAAILDRSDSSILFVSS